MYREKKRRIKPFFFLDIYKKFDTMICMNHQKHYVQDAGEKYFVYIVAIELKRIKKLHNIQSVAVAKKNFDSHVEERSCRELFSVSEYKKIYDKGAVIYVQDLIQKFGNLVKFDILDVEKTSRDAGKKADFRVNVYSGDYIKKTIEQSLKCYETSSNIQVCSGTFLSTALSILFDKQGVGKFKNPATGEVFSSSNIPKLEAALDVLGNETKKNTMALRNIQKEVEVWKADPTKQEWKKITYTDFKGVAHLNIDDSAWQAFCHDYGCKGRDGIAKVIMSVDSDRLKRFFGKVIGITGDEEVLILAGDNTYINSIYNNKAQKLVSVFNDKKSTVKIIVNDEKKGVTLQLITGTGEIILEAYIPTTINKNGMWQLDEIEGRVLSNKKYKGTLVPYGHRRPDKLEIATSTNCWIDIRKYLQ